MDGCVYKDKAKKNGAQDYAVTDDLPSPLPVTEAELDLLESALPGLIDDILGASGGRKQREPETA